MINEVIISHLIFFPIVSSNFAKMMPEPENIFLKTNEQTLAIMDDVFVALKMNANFTKAKNVADDLSIHSVIQDAATKNYQMYENILKTSKIEICNKTAYFISNINEIIEEMIRKQNFEHTVNVSNKNNNIYNVSNDEILTDFVNLAKAFNLKVNTLPNNLKLLDSELSWPDLKSRRLYNGNRTNIKKYPFVASVHVADRFTCAGSLIRQDLVITAASCLVQFHNSRKIHPTIINVRVGSDFTNKRGKPIDIKSLHFHPMFNKTTLYNNLVILKMATPVRLRKHRIISIKFDKDACEMPHGVKKVSVLGWGERSRQNQNRLEGNDLRLSHAFLNVYKLQECRKAYSRVYVTAHNFCAGFVTKGTGACQNDIGGPAVVGSTLMGVLSYGSPHCGRSFSPTVFTKLGYYSDWIESTFKNIPLNNQPFSKAVIPLESDENNDGSGSVVRIDELYILKQIKTDIQHARQKNYVPDDLYGPPEDGTFKSSPKLDVYKHPLINQSLYLDPNLYNIPDFFEQSTFASPPIRTTAPYIIAEKEVEDDPDAYNQLMSYLSSQKPKTERTEVTEPTALVTPEFAFDSENAYGEFAFETTPLLLTSDVVTTNPTTQPMTRMLPSTDTYYESDETDEQAQDETSDDKDTVGDEVKLVIYYFESGSTQRFLLNKRDPQVEDELKRLKNLKSLSAAVPVTTQHNEISM